MSKVCEKSKKIHNLLIHPSFDCNGRYVERRSIQTLSKKSYNKQVISYNEVFFNVKL